MIQHNLGTKAYAHRKLINPIQISACQKAKSANLMVSKKAAINTHRLKAAQAKTGNRPFLLLTKLPTKDAAMAGIKTSIGRVAWHGDVGASSTIVLANLAIKDKSTMSVKQMHTRKI